MKLLNSIASMTAVAALALVLPSLAGAQTPAAASGSTAPQAQTTHKKTNKTAKAKPAQAATAKPAPAKAGATPDGKVVPTAARRDPFLSLLNATKADGSANLPPGKAGLVIASIRVDGTIKSGTSMLAVVSNSQQRVYFVREGDRLYDGEVEKISLDEVVFRESTKDAFGKPVEREVTKRLYASAGEQQ
jgi:hypothetical protein